MKTKITALKDEILSAYSLTKQAALVLFFTCFPERFWTS